MSPAVIVMATVVFNVAVQFTICTIVAAVMIAAGVVVVVVEDEGAWPLQTV